MQVSRVQLCLVAIVLACSTSTELGFAPCIAVHLPPLLPRAARRSQSACRDLHPFKLCVFCAAAAAPQMSVQQMSNAFPPPALGLSTAPAMRTPLPAPNELMGGRMQPPPMQGGMDAVRVLSPGREACRFERERMAA